MWNLKSRLQKRKTTLLPILCIFEFLTITVLIGTIEKPHPIVAVHLFVIGILALELYYAFKTTL